MPAIVVMDTTADGELTGVENAVNGLVKRAENSGEPFFYVLPEGAELPDELDKPTVHEVRRYEDEETWYDDVRLDEYLTNNPIDKVIQIGPAPKEDELAAKEQARGRSAQNGRNADPNN